MPKLMSRPSKRSAVVPADEPDGSPGAAAEVDRARQRFLRRRRARRWALLRRLLAVVAVVGLVVGGVWLVFFSPVLAVHDVEVRGTQVLSADEVRAAADVPLDVPLATSDLGAVQARVEELAAVESAAVSRSWPDTLRIEVTERKAVAAVDWEGSWRGVDTTGVLFRTYPEQPKGLPRITIRAGTSSEALAEAGQVVAALPTQVRDRLAYVEVRSVDAIALHLGNGAVVQWGSADESADKARVLQVLLERPAREYDVTAPGRPTLHP